jgi:hypothetical protein
LSPPNLEGGPAVAGRPGKGGGSPGSEAGQRGRRWPRRGRLAVGARSGWGLHGGGAVGVDEDGGGRHEAAG